MARSLPIKEEKDLEEQVRSILQCLGEDPDRWLVIGPDRAADLLEVVVLVTAEGAELIIHAMALRAVYRKLLDP